MDCPTPQSAFQLSELSPEMNHLPTVAITRPPTRCRLTLGPLNAASPLRKVTPTIPQSPIDEPTSPYYNTPNARLSTTARSWTSR